MKTALFIICAVTLFIISTVKQRMLMHELLVVLVDQGEATQVAELPVPGGGCCRCLCYMELAEVTLQPAGMHSMSLEASLRLQHRHGLVQVISNVDDRCLSVQGSGSLQCSVLAWHNENIFHYKDGQTLKQIPWGVWGISVLEDF